jgi:hypothetical protein
MTQYENEYDRHRDGGTPPGPETPPSGSGVKGLPLLRFFGSMSVRDAQSMGEVIRRGCERVDTGK